MSRDPSDRAGTTQKRRPRSAATPRNASFPAEFQALVVCRSGLVQIKPATAAGIGYRGATAGLYDPATNLEWGMKYLGGAYELGGGDVCGTALRYQGGHRATRPTASANRYCASLKAVMADGDE